MIDKICANCRRRLSEFYNTGMLGCPNCYKSFSNEIDLSLRKIQGATYHSGKSPKINSEDKDLLLEYQRLIKEREEATLSSKFSRARELSEQINSLYVTLKRRGLI